MEVVIYKDKGKLIYENLNEMNNYLILVILLFILPTFNLVQSYRNLLERRTQLMHLQKRYEEISNEKESQKAFANKLKDEEYAAKYARAKYYYSKQGEYIYTIPGLLPQ